MYQVLARKYRPSKLEEIVGQDVVVQIIKNSILQNRLHHAVLLYGPMGVGKTSIARIIAKSLNCKNGPTVEPCGVCDACISISAFKNVDVVEIDGASNRKVENARNIIESVKYPPISSKYKIYIIDEVHMLTNEAFNALLKTIEEPPKYVKFIFATTAIEKMPDTVLSRCQILSLRKIPFDKIVEKLNMVKNKENINITSGAIEMIANAAYGSLRVAEGYLDRCIAYNNVNISESDVESVLGIVSYEMVQKYVNLILDGNESKVSDLINIILNSNLNLEYFIRFVIRFLLTQNIPKEIKISLSDIYYNAFLDLRKRIDEKIVLIHASHKAMYVKSLEKIESLIEKVSSMNLELELNNVRYNANDHDDTFNSPDSNINLVLKEFSGKIIYKKKIEKKMEEDND